ncbi:MAG: hypothetical protein U1E51_03675 [Candidatus Binatia bacterium]|nr:hypothetical protein [Candidatus Binatia bacterium]
MPIPPPRARLLVIAIALGCIACASTKIVNQWTDPDYSAPRFKRILVLGVSTQAGIRRTFEDEFVNQLKAAGVYAVPSYRYIPEDGRVDEARVQEAVKKANADAAIITRLVRVEKKTDITPGYYQPAPALTLGCYGGYSAAWLGRYEPPHIYQYEVYISETSLYDMANNQIVWTGTAQTTAPGDINKEIKRYVEAVTAALKK